MPLPMWVARNVAKRFEASELKRGRWPVFRHVGRVSGNTYRTPLGAPEVDGGYVSFSRTVRGWTGSKNALAAGSAVLEIDGDEVELVSPRLISKDEAWQLLPPTTKGPPSFLHVVDFLRMDRREAPR